MSKKLLLAVFAIPFIFWGCDCDACKVNEDLPTIKVCSLGDQTGESCVEHAVDKYDIGTKFIHIRTRGGERFAYNLNGWSIMMIKYRKRRD